MTIRLGYADVTFRKCKKCSSPDAYTTEETCPSCGTETEVLRTASFVDAPGHEALMSTMLSGASIMDGAIMVISANQTCPQPQTKEHMIALKILDIKNIVVVQNKIDTVDDGRAHESLKEIQEFLKANGFETLPIIPISAQHGVNIDVLEEAMNTFIPTPKRDATLKPKLLVARSFDVNKPGTPIKNLKGGVVGGALAQGKLKVGDEIEIVPGLKKVEANQTKWVSLKSKVVNISIGNQLVEEAAPGGSLGIATGLDPALTKSDSVAGSTLGLVGQLPPLQNKLQIEVHLLEKVVGAEAEIPVKPLEMNEALLLNVNAGMTSGMVTGTKPVQIVLKKPVCAEKGDRVAISRRVQDRWRLIGWGILK